MFTLIVAVALSQAPVCRSENGVLKCLVEGNRVEHGNHTARTGGRAGPLMAFFEFAPLSGAGLSAACACTAVTGAKGEAVTWARGSAASAPRR